MSNKEKSIYFIAFSEKKTNWDSWFEKFLLPEKQKVYKKLLGGNGTMSGVDKSPTLDGYKI